MYSLVGMRSWEVGGLGYTSSSALGAGGQAVATCSLWRIGWAISGSRNTSVLPLPVCKNRGSNVACMCVDGWGSGYGQDMDESVIKPILDIIKRAHQTGEGQQQHA
jgi:hypothetical protein